MSLRRETWCRSWKMIGQHGQFLLLSETPQRDTILLSVVDGDNSAAIALDAEQWHSLGEMFATYRQDTPTVLTRQEQVEQALEDSAPPVPPVHGAPPAHDLAALKALVEGVRGTGVRDTMITLEPPF